MFFFSTFQTTKSQDNLNVTNKPWIFEEIPKCDHSNENYLAVLSCIVVIMLYEVDLTFETVDEMPKCEYPNKRYWAVLPLCSRYHLICCKKWFYSFETVLSVISTQNKSYWAVRLISVLLFIALYNVVLAFEYAEDIPNYGHSNENYLAVLSRGAVYSAIRG